MFYSKNLSLNMPKNALFLLKNRLALGALPPDPLASGAWEICSETLTLWRPRDSPPDPRISPHPMTKSWLRACIQLYILLPV